MYFLGVDIGGTMTKAALFDNSGKQIAKHAVDTPSLFVHQGWVERDINKLWSLVCECIKKTVEASGVDSKLIKAVGCTGHGKGLYLWGKDGAPAAFGIASTDHRAAEIASRWEADGTTDRAAEKTLQRVRDCQPAALLRWFKEERREAYDNIKWVFEAKDLIRFLLTDEAFAEYTDYSGSALLNLKTAQFDRELLELYGIEEIYDALPPLRRSHDNCGTVTKRAAEITGLCEGTVVCGGMFDIDACAIAADVSRPELLCVITGTWSINEYISPAPALGSPTTLNSLFCLPEYYLVEESSPTSVGNLEWLVREVMGEEKGYFKKADELVETLQPQDSNVIFLPFLYGSNSPSVENAVFYGLNSSHTRAHLLRALFEGAVFSHKQHIDRLLALSDNLTRIRISGGMVNSAVWTQMFADAIGLPVDVIKAEEMGAKGAAMAAAVSVGAYSDFNEAAQSMVRVTQTILPDPEKHSIYEKKYQKYRSLLTALEAID